MESLLRKKLLSKSVNWRGCEGLLQGLELEFDIVRRKKWLLEINWSSWLLNCTLLEHLLLGFLVVGLGRGLALGRNSLGGDGRLGSLGLVDLHRLVVFQIHLD